MNNTKPYENYIDRIICYTMSVAAWYEVHGRNHSRRTNRPGDRVAESDGKFWLKDETDPKTENHGTKVQFDRSEHNAYIGKKEEHPNRSGLDTDKEHSKRHNDTKTGEDQNSGLASDENLSEDISESNGTSSTPYDDAFKTMMGKGGDLRIAFVNEMFHPDSPVKPGDRIDETSNEYFTEQGNGAQRKIITDNVLHIDGKTYHIECQSLPDGTMLVRMDEYDVAIGVKESVYEDSHLVLNIPASGVLYLRSTGTTPDEMTVTVNTVGGSVDYPVKVMKLSDYTMDDLIEKNLLFLFPFYMFNLESDIKSFGKEESKERVISTFTELLEYVNGLYEKEELSFDKYLLLTDMVKKVADSLSRNHGKARKELNSIMGGKILEFKGERIYNSGIQKGLEEGIKQGEQKGKVYELLDLAYDHTLPVDAAAKRAETRYGVPRDEFMKMLETYIPDDELMQG